MLTKPALLKALDDEGHGLARIATLSAIDKDGDTYASGAFGGAGGQWGHILAAHNWSHIPLGKARVYEEGDQALAELHLNLDIPAGRDWHAALKFDLGHASDHPVVEWSYGFQVLDSAMETRAGERVRVLKRLQVFEVSPVVRGAGNGTGTLAMKGLDEKTAAIAAFLDEIEADVREGRMPTEAQLKQLRGLRDGLDGLFAEQDRKAAIARQLFARDVHRRVRHHLVEGA